MEQILLAYETPKNCRSINDAITKHESKSSDGDTDYFDIVVGVLWGDALALYLFIICQDFVLWTLIDLMKENGFT